MARPGPYAPLEAQARSRRAGLWALPGALEPRSFRQRFGRCQ
jgi:micrococcal nuclease